MIPSNLKEMENVGRCDELNFGRTLFGFKTKDVINEIERLKNVHRVEEEALQAQIANARAEFNHAESRLLELQKKLDNYFEQERQIAEIMITAQINAQRIETQAREQAEALLSNSEEEWHRRNQELENLRMQVSRFKEEFRQTLLDYIEEPWDDTIFLPKLVTLEKTSARPRMQKRSS